LKTAITEIYPQTCWKMVADPTESLGSAEHFSGTTGEGFIIRKTTNASPKL